jgi:hypothetical protein
MIVPKTKILINKLVGYTNDDAYELKEKYDVFIQLEKNLFLGVTYDGDFIIDSYYIRINQDDDTNSSIFNALEVMIEKTNIYKVYKDNDRLRFTTINEIFNIHFGSEENRVEKMDIQFMLCGSSYDQYNIYLKAPNPMRQATKNARVF